MGTELMEQGLSYRGKLANRLFYKPVFMELLETSFFMIMTGVVSKQDIAFIDELENIVQKKNGCGFTPKGDVSIYNRTISVNPTKVNLAICVDAFNNTLEQEMLLKGNDKDDITAQQLMGILQKLVRNGMVKDYNRIAWFGDMASSDPNLNMADGFWLHLYNLVNANAIPYIDLNSGVALAPEDGLAYVMAVYDAAPLNLKMLDKSMKQIHVSGDVYDQYAKDIGALGGGDTGMMMLINGIQSLTYDGVLLVPHYEWTRFTTANGNPNTHQVLYTARKNLVFATDLYSDLSALEIFYNNLHEKTYIKANNSIGTNYVHESLFSVGY